MAKSCVIYHPETGLWILSVPESICFFFRPDQFLEPMYCKASLEVAQQMYQGFPQPAYCFFSSYHKL